MRHRAVGSSCSSAPEGDVYRCSQGEPWDRNGGCLAAVQAAARLVWWPRGGWGHPLPSSRPLLGGRGEGAWGWERGARPGPLSCRAADSSLCSNRAFSWEPRGIGRRAQEVRSKCSPGQAWPRGVSVLRATPEL